MFHPLLKTLATRPHLLIDHLGGYADLVTAQTTEALKALRSRAVLVVCLGLALMIAALLSGVALLLLALMPIERMAQPWLLLLVPAVPWLLVLVFGLKLKAQPAMRHFEPVREQFAADAALFKEAGEA